VKTIFSLILVFLSLAVEAANVRNYMRDSFTGQIDTNALLITRISTNILASGGVTGSGRAVRVPFSPYTNFLSSGFYSVSNLNLRTAYVINVDDDTSTLYDCTNILHSGFNTYAVVQPTFSNITNGLGYLPATNGASSGGLSTNTIRILTSTNLNLLDDYLVRGGSEVIADD